MKHVISVGLQNDLKKALQGKHFSILMDESTDVSVKKLSAVCCRYYDEKQHAVVDAYLEIVETAVATGSALFEALDGCLDKFNLKWSNCIGFGCDGASSMVGQYNSVWSRIQQKNRDVLLMKCICHSLDLAEKHVFESMPSQLGFLLSAVPGWFSKSDLRREKYRTLAEEFEEVESEQNTSEENSNCSRKLPFLKSSKTRWLVRSRVIKRIITNWIILQSYFSDEANEATQSTKFKANMLKNLFNDSLNYLYLIFLNPVVHEAEKVNALFQSRNLDPSHMLKELEDFSKSLKSRIYNNLKQELPAKWCDFGIEFKQKVDNMKSKVQSHDIQQRLEHDLETVQENCKAFSKVLITLVESRRALFIQVCILNLAYYHRNAF